LLCDFRSFEDVSFLVRGVGVDGEPYRGSIIRINPIGNTQFFGDQVPRQKAQNIGRQVQAGDLIGIIGIRGVFAAGMGNSDAAGTVDIFLRRLAAALSHETLYSGAVVWRRSGEGKISGDPFLRTLAIRWLISMILK
jgi:hypothetical protein